MSPAGETRIEWLTIAGDPDRWRSLGLVVTAEGFVPLPGTSLRIVPPALRHAADASDPTDPDSDSDADAVAPDRDGGSTSGIVGWALSGVRVHVETVDGLATELVDAPVPRYADHVLGATGLDHVVVLTPDLERTSDAIALTTGAPLKRVREVGTMRQGFHRVGRGGLIVELVERPEVPAGPASFWGVVIEVADIDAACDRLGPERIGPPKDAVQPGRRIATFRPDAVLGVHVALMTR